MDLKFKNFQTNYWFFICTSFYVVILILCIFSYATNIYEHSIFIEFRYERVITIVSLFYFSLLLVISFTSEKYFWFLLPFVVLTVPNAINSIFPGLLLTHLGERGNASFSFVSHIDIYLISNFLVQIIRKKFTIRLQLDGFYLIAFTTVLLGGGLLYKSVEAILHAQDYIFIINGAFHFRYLFLVLLFAPLLKFKIFEKVFILGVMFSIPLLALESMISTLLSGASIFGELKSGNFANNVFGNFLAFLFIFFITIDKSYCLNNFFHRSVKLLLLSLILMTGVRGAMLSVVIGLVGYFLIIRMKPINLLLSFIVLLIIILATLTIFDSWESVDYLFKLFSSFQVVLERGYGAQGIAIDEKNSSLITRVAIWKGTFFMAIDNWFFGIGASQWNYLKESYGIPFKVLLDPHNDYLNFFCLYGLPGLLFIYCLYIKPMHYVFANKLSKNINPYMISLFTLSVSSITNANSSKHQVFIIVIIFFILAIFFEKKNKE